MQLIERPCKKIAEKLMFVPLPGRGGRGHRRDPPERQGQGRALRQGQGTLRLTTRGRRGGERSNNYHALVQGQCRRFSLRNLSPILSLSLSSSSCKQLSSRGRANVQTRFRRPLSLSLLFPRPYRSSPPLLLIHGERSEAFLRTFQPPPPSTPFPFPPDLDLPEN